jgi:hypothetical protein
MKWPEFLARFVDMPLFHSSMLKVFSDDPRVIRVQLSRWVRAGKIARLRREWYLVEKPWQTRGVPLSYIATQIVQPSYLSLESAFQHHGMIPEAVENPTCLTTDRPRHVQALGRLFLYHHIQPDLLAGFALVSVEGLTVPVASAEKALFDKIYLYVQHHRFSMDWLSELRLQNMAAFDIEIFLSFASKSSKWGLRAAVDAAADFIQKELR